MSSDAPDVFEEHYLQNCYTSRLIDAELCWVKVGLMLVDDDACKQF